MKSTSKILKGLIKISGKILFVIGLVLNICMMFFGFWPSIIYLLFMLLGGFMVYTNKDVDTSVQFNFKNFNFRNLGNNFNKEDFEKSVVSSIKAVFFTIIITTIAIVGFFYFSQSYFKNEDTKKDCEEIVMALNSYKKDLSNYPKNLDSLIGNNPLRKGWKKDRWNNDYYYKVLNLNKNFILISKGKDQKLFTKDDIVFKN
jgi:uncharacterized membrane protein